MVASGRKSIFAALRSALTAFASESHACRKRTGGEWNRTTDPGLMSPMLCQLSYATIKLVIASEAKQSKTIDCFVGLTASSQ